MPANILSLRDMVVTNECPADDSKCTGRVTNIIAVLTTGAGTGIDPRYFVVPLNTVQGIINGNNIIEVMNRIANDPRICAVNDDFNSTIKLTALLLDAFRTNETGGESGIFISQGKFNNLFSSEDLLRIFLGLLYQKYQATSGICYQNLNISGHNLQAIFSDIITQRTKFSSILTSFDKINLAYYTIKRQILDAKQPDLSNFAAISVASISGIRDFTESVYTVIGAPVPDAYQQLYVNLSIASDFCADIQQRNYTGIFNDVIRFVQKNKIVTDETNQKVVKYLSFAANLASASNSDEVRNAVDAVALPPGSYSIKQKSAHSIALNAYVGYAWDLNGGLYARGAYAPLGFSFSAGLGKKNGGSISIFTSVIDVGALVSYRLKEGNTEELKQEVRLESIISPSAQLILGLPKLPLSLCAGWRLAPKLFYSKENVFETVAPKSVFNLGVLIDVPIFTIFNKPYN
jgi:hypothetical protein